MKIKPPTVGPIVGSTTSKETRIFLRGDVQLVDDQPRRCFGVLQWRKPGAKWSKPLLNKLAPHFDGTCVFVIGGLSADQLYEYRAGWFFADADLGKLGTIGDDELEWEVDQVYSFSTGIDAAAQPRRFAVGSCRYLLRLLGGAVFDDRGDKAFATISAIHRKDPIHALLMVGDQIYADDLNFFFPDTTLDQYFKRYRQAFGQKHVQSLMASVPTYMILDDHEIEDNWPAQATDKDRHHLYPNAIHAYQVYQCSHSPVFGTVAGCRITGTPDHFWYKFRDGCSDWFVCDTRTERLVGATPPRMLSDTQMKELLGWLSAPNGDRVRFVVTSVPMFPDFESDRSDKWQGFPEQREQILDHIRQNTITKVVFVSGDVHCSYVAELSIPGAPGFKVHSVISSSFFWPYPHTALADLKFGLPLSGTVNAQYVPKLVTKDVVRDDNFAVLSVRPDGFTVDFLERKGKKLGHASVKF